MANDARMALGIPRVVNTALGPIPVNQLSAVQFIVLTETVTGLGMMIRLEAAADGDVFGAMQRILAREPLKLIGLFCSATGRTAEELGSLPLDEFLDIGLAFLDQHEKSIARFFELKSRWDALAAAKNRPSPSSSTRSSRPAGPSPTSAPSPTNSSSATDGSELSAPSMTG